MLIMEKQRFCSLLFFFFFKLTADIKFIPSVFFKYRMSCLRDTKFFLFPKDSESNLCRKMVKGKLLILET